MSIGPRLDIGERDTMVQLDRIDHHNDTHRLPITHRAPILNTAWTWVLQEPGLEEKVEELGLLDSHSPNIMMDTLNQYPVMT